MIKLINHILPCRPQPVYVAVSMGVDSLAACFYLSGRGYIVVPIHFNHKLRPQNDLMAARFKELFPRGIIGEASRPLETESECRTARLEFFKQTINNGYLVTGHHLDDYQETYLLNCFRGKAEYKPMRLVSNFISFKILHPFLLTDKADFVEFVDKYDNGKLKNYLVADETNAMVKGSRRNWIRNEIVPAMTAQKISLKKYCKGLIMKDIESFTE